jgi:hypothetical protein
MKTLVIHPDDRSTDFLKEIYEGRGYTVITDRQTSARKLTKLVCAHKRIIMMGHGCPHGLLGMLDQFMNYKFIGALREKECVAIWCNADQYVRLTGIRGFYTGMFLSEVDEANYFRIKTTQENVTYSNLLFTGLVKVFIDYPDKLLTEIKMKYTGDCPVIKFNNERLYYKSKVTIGIAYNFLKQRKKKYSYYEISQQDAI